MLKKNILTIDGMFFDQFVIQNSYLFTSDVTGWDIQFEFGIFGSKSRANGYGIDPCAKKNQK